MTTTNGIFLRSSQELRKDLRINNPVKISQLRVCNGMLLASIGPSTLLKLSVVLNEKPTEIVIPNAPSGLSPAHLHLSPSGRHALFSYQNGENYYVHTATGACFSLKRIRGVITAVGWNSEIQKDEETGSILLGTLNGGIYEAVITSQGAVTHFKEIRTTYIEKDSPICDIQLRLISDEDERNSRWICFVCQPARLYSFIGYVDLGAMRSITRAQTGYMGAAALQAGWMAMVPPGENQEPVFFQLFNPKGINHVGVLKAQSPVLAKSAQISLYPPRDEPKKFIWLSGSGYIIGTIDLSIDNASEALVEEKSVTLPRVEGNVEEAIGVALSEWHAHFAFSSRVIAVSIYTYAVVYEDKIPTEMGLIRGLTTDASSEFNWAFTETHSIKYRSNDEARYVWRILLERGDYAKAVAVARDRRAIDPSAFEFVLRRQADKHLQDKNYIAAAEILAYSSEPFETVVLCFLSTEDDRRNGLKTLLEKKLDQYTRPEERIKRDSLVMWLLEVQLEELAESRRSSGNVEGDRTRQLTKQLHMFLNRKTVFEFVSSNRESVYKLINSHADFETHLYIANGLKDFETMINLYLMRENYVDALEIIKTQNTPEFYYKYAPVLANHIPQQLFKCLLCLPRLRPNRFLSLFTQCQNEDEMASAALPYLEWAVKSPTGLADVALHNILISMYACHAPTKLKNYLESMGRDRASIPYDIDFALRTCQQYARDDCIVYLSCVNEMFMEAVEIALKINTELAKSCARWMERSEDDFFSEKSYPEELRRRVWLKIASHVICSGTEATTAIGLLKESQDVIKIQDILPFFPQFVEIQHFKEPLCECLREHSTKIQDLQRAMREATQIAADIREKSEKLNKRATVIMAGQLCSFCSRSLLSRPFFAHACRHFFHRDCLEGMIRPFLFKQESLQLDELEKLESRLIESLNAEEQVGTPSGAQFFERERKLTQVNVKIGDILGVDCPLCSDRAYNSIDRSFFTDDEYAYDERTWMTQLV